MSKRKPRRRQVEANRTAVRSMPTVYNHLCNLVANERRIALARITRLVEAFGRYNYIGANGAYVGQDTKQSIFLPNVRVGVDLGAGGWKSERGLHLTEVGKSINYKNVPGEEAMTNGIR